ncbi:hypothetical protein SK128_011007 [Halocaridina rubra]|uniref:Uncharacterized protein n=1 Tax=Halocaridina rubra TaxID=373956 RepID=A0AAN8WNZ4_HALRR
MPKIMETAAPIPARENKNKPELASVESPQPLTCRPPPTVTSPEPFSFDEGSSEYTSDEEDSWGGGDLGVLKAWRKEPSKDKKSKEPEPAESKTDNPAASKPPTKKNPEPKNIPESKENPKKSPDNPKDNSGSKDTQKNPVPKNLKNKPTTKQENESSKEVKDSKNAEVKTAPKRRTGAVNLTDHVVNDTSQAISELRLEKDGAISRRYTVGNVVEYTRDTPVNITVHPLENEANNYSPSQTNNSLEQDAEVTPKREKKSKSNSDEPKAVPKFLLDEDNMENEWSSGPPIKHPQRPSLPILNRPQFLNLSPSQQSPSLLSPPDEEIPPFILSTRRRSKTQLPEILETPEEEDRGIQLFLRQRRKSLNLKVRK